MIWAVVPQEVTLRDIYLANGEKAGIGPKQPMGLQGGARLITPPASPEKEMGKPDAGAGSRDFIFTEI